MLLPVANTGLTNAMGIWFFMLTLCRLPLVTVYCPLPVDEDGEMRVKVKLFATLVVYLPGVKAGISFEVELANGSSLSDLINQLNIPQREAKVIFVNGRTQPLNYQLQNNDEVGVFPPIGGG